MRLTVPTAAFLMILSAGAGAQMPDSARTPASFWASGLSIGMPSAGGQTEASLFTVGASFSHLRKGVGADLAIMTMPRILMESVVPVFARAGATVPVEVNTRTYVLPMIGVIGVSALGPGGGVATAGVYAGAAIMAFGESSGLRAAYTLNRFESTSVWLLEIGFVRGPSVK